MYQVIAGKFLGEQHYDHFFLEWDDEHAGKLSDLEVLRDKPKVEVVLGLLSSKHKLLIMRNVYFKCSNNQVKICQKMPIPFPSMWLS